MNFAQQLATDLTNIVSGKPARKAPAKPAKATAKPAPAKAAAKPAKAQTPAAPTPAKAVAYKAGKAFAPKAGGKYRQIENWAVVMAALPATREELIAAIKAAELDNAVGFVQARIRKGHLLPA